MHTPHHKRPLTPFVSTPFIYYEAVPQDMAGRSLSLTLSAIILMVIGGWFIITSLLPILDIDLGYYSVTVSGAIFYLYFGLEFTNAELLQYLFPVLGVLGLVVGFLLLGGKGRGFGFIAYIVTLALAILGLITVFAFMGMSTGDEYWDFIAGALKSGNIIDALGAVFEPLLIAVASVFGIVMLMIGKSK
jgi:hypothetical protein